MLVANQVLYFNVVLHTDMASDSSSSSMINLNHNEGDVKENSSRIFDLDLKFFISSEIFIFCDRGTIGLMLLFLKSQKDYSIFIFF